MQGHFSERETRETSAYSVLGRNISSHINLHGNVTNSQFYVGGSISFSGDTVINFDTSGGTVNINFDSSSTGQQATFLPGKDLATGSTGFALTADFLPLTLRSRAHWTSSCFLVFVQGRPIPEAVMITTAFSTGTKSTISSRRRSLVATLS